MFGITRNRYAVTIPTVYSNIINTGSFCKTMCKCKVKEGGAKCSVLLPQFFLFSF